jgi:hypothetical protein
MYFIFEKGFDLKQDLGYEEYKKLESINKT